MPQKYFPPTLPLPRAPPPLSLPQALSSFWTERGWLVWTRLLNLTFWVLAWLSSTIASLICIYSRKKTSLICPSLPVFIDCKSTTVLCFLTAKNSCKQQLTENTLHLKLKHNCVTAVKFILFFSGKGSRRYSCCRD